MIDTMMLEDRPFSQDEKEKLTIWAMFGPESIVEVEDLKDILFVCCDVDDLVDKH